MTWLDRFRDRFNAQVEDIFHLALKGYIGPSAAIVAGLLFLSGFIVGLVLVPDVFWTLKAQVISRTTTLALFHLGWATSVGSVTARYSFGLLAGVAMAFILISLAQRPKFSSSLLAFATVINLLPFVVAFFRYYPSAGDPKPAGRTP